MNLKRRGIAFALPIAAAATVAVLLTTAVTAQQKPAPADVTTRVDALFAEFAKPDSPGCSIAVIRDHQIIYRRGYGMADLDHAVANDAGAETGTVFNVASVSKQFTATSILLLAQRGTLSVDDEARKYLPELPAYERPITIRHLLTHTSGIRDFIVLISMAGRSLDSVMNDTELLDLIARQRSLNFLPGDDYSYSNSGYILLGLIVERVSGQTFGRFVEKEIFTPLGMTHSRVFDDRFAIVRNRATGYFRRPDGGGFAQRNSAWDRPYDGGVLTTVDDLARWDRNFYQPVVGDASLITQLTTSATLRSGKSTEYGFGLRVERYRGKKLIAHAGGIRGFSAQIYRFPNDRFSSIVLCNTGTANATTLARSIADLYLFDGAPDAATTDAAAPTAAAAATADRDSNNAATTKAPAAASASASLGAYAGTYASEEVEATVTIAARDGRLWLERRFAKPQALTATMSTAADVFRLGSGDSTTLTFTREGGRIVRFTFDGGRAKGVRFERRDAK
jgi:CubicO group peptidase (beta-lactamase class C family)